MGYGPASCSTVIVFQDKISEFFASLGLSLEIENLEELYQPFADEFTRTDFVDCFESKDFESSIRECMDNEVEELLEGIEKVKNFLALLGEAEEKTDLSFYLLWVGDEGGRYDDLCNEFAIEVGGVYQRTPAGEKYQEYLYDVSWVVYG